MAWRVQLNGDAGVLQELAAVSQTPELTIRKDQSVFVVESTRFDTLTNPPEVRDRAVKLLESVNGAAAIALGLSKPITVGAVEGPPAANGGRNLYVFAEGTVTVTGTVSAVVSIRHADGMIETHRPGDPVHGWVALAEGDQQVADVLRQWGTGARDWNTLYQLREKIAAAVGGDGVIMQQGWCSEPELERFNWTANSQAVLGDAARHGVQKHQPPPNPMSGSEARQLIERLIRGLIELRQSNS